MSKPNQFLSPEGDLEDYFVDEYWLIDQYVGDQLWTWGYGNQGRLGNGTYGGFTSTPVTTFSGGTNWKQISCGNRYTAAIKTDGTLWTWGYGAQGNLGNATVFFTSTPVTTFSGGTNWKQVSAGFYTTAAIKTDGTLWTWGYGAQGNLGNASVTGRSTPVTTFAGGTNWKQVTCGQYHTAAIKTDGTLWTWGRGSYARLGNGITTGSAVYISTPITTFAGGTNWKQVSCGTDNTAAIKTDGTLWVWGQSKSGTGSAINYASTPITTFAGGTNWKQVDCRGISHTAAIKTDGTLWTWGAGSSGQLGHAKLSTANTPITTFAGGTNWKQVSCGSNGNHTAAIKTDGTLWIWGRGSEGQLGNASVTGRSTPVTTFSGGTNWKQVGTGGENTATVQAGINAEYPLS
jgi:alpha-tubulin suppressor-like RCC1 family protein